MRRGCPVADRMDSRPFYPADFRGLGVVQRAVYRALDDAGEDLRAVQVAERLPGIPYSAVHRALGGLESRGFVWRRQVNGVSVWRACH